MTLAGIVIVVDEVQAGCAGVARGIVGHGIT